MADTSAVLERAIAELTDLVRAQNDQIADLRAELDRRLPEPVDGPLTTWKRIARALGVSHDTLTKRRQESKDHHRPWFPDVEAARLWYDGLLQPKPARKRAPKKASVGGPVDWNAVAKGGAV
jgi:hypothetical protein